MRTREGLASMQAAPLSVKVIMTQQRIREWVNEYGEEGVYISFSGGKDSTVLCDIVDKMYPNNQIPKVFINTGLEYPEIVQFVKTKSNVVMLRPKKNFKQVITEYGYPFISKEVSKVIFDARNAIKRGNDDSYALKQLNGEYINPKNNTLSPYNKEKWKFMLNSPFLISSNCCNELKKKTAHSYSHKNNRYPMTAEQAQESKQRETQWIKHGCNGFQMKEPISRPMSFWTEQDILHYIKKNNVEICSVYGNIVEDNDELAGQMSFADFGIDTYEDKKLKTTGCKRTGCIFCGYGCHLEKEGEGRFERMKETRPKLYDYVMRPTDQGGLGYKEIIDWLNENGNLKIKY